MHRNRWRLGLRPRGPDPTGGAYSAPTDPLAGLRGPTSKGPTSKGRGGERRGGRGGEGILLRNSFRGLVTPLVLKIHNLTFSDAQIDFNDTQFV